MAIKFKWETEFKETEIGKIPKEGEVSQLGEDDKFVVIMGQSPPSKYYNQNEDEMPFVQDRTEFRDLFIEIDTSLNSLLKVPNNPTFRGTNFMSQK